MRPLQRDEEQREPGRLFRVRVMRGWRGAGAAVVVPAPVVPRIVRAVHRSDRRRAAPGP